MLAFLSGQLMVSHLFSKVLWINVLNKIIKNIAIKGLQLTIKGWAEKEEPSPEWRITEAKEDWFTEDNPNQRCQML